MVIKKKSLSEALPTAYKAIPQADYNRVGLSPRGIYRNQYLNVSKNSCVFTYNLVNLGNFLHFEIFFNPYNSGQFEWVAIDVLSNGTVKAYYIRHNTTFLRLWKQENQLKLTTTVDGAFCFANQMCNGGNIDGFAFVNDVNTEGWTSLSIE